MKKIMVILAIVVWIGCIYWLLFSDRYVTEYNFNISTSPTTYEAYEPTEFICDRYKPNDEMRSSERLDASIEYKECLIRQLER